MQSIDISKLVMTNDGRRVKKLTKSVNFIYGEVEGEKTQSRWEFDGKTCYGAGTDGRYDLVNFELPDLNESEAQILREIAGQLPTSTWSSWIGPVYESLIEKSAVHGSIHSAAVVLAPGAAWLEANPPPTTTRDKSEVVLDLSNVSISVADPYAGNLRCRTSEWCEAEVGIVDAMADVERMGASHHLTNAVTLLSAARQAVAQHVLSTQADAAIELASVRRTILALGYDLGLARRALSYDEVPAGAVKSDEYLAQNDETTR